MSTLHLMEDRLGVLLKKAMVNLEEDGFLVPVAFAFTPTLEMIVMPGDKSSGIDDMKQWADLIRHALAKYDAQFYVIIAESYVRRANTLVNAVSARGGDEAITVHAFHRTGESIAKTIPFCRDNAKITFSKPEVLKALGGVLGENLFV